ncbi:kinase, partial [Thraustotheca clavata]
MAGRGEQPTKKKTSIRMPKCFMLPQDSLKHITLLEPIPHWYWKSFAVGKYYGRDVYLKQILRPVDDEKQVQTFQSIAAFLTDVHHPNIVQFLGVVAAPHYATWSIVSERLAQGDLATLQKKSTIVLTKEQIIQILFDVACALAYLHGQSPPMLHRDLRAASIHITHDFRAKITNFELSGQLGLNKALVGTPAWVAPEIMRRDVD